MSEAPERYALLTFAPMVDSELCRFVLVALPAKANLVVGDAGQTGVGDAEPMRVDAEIGQHLRGSAEG